MLLKIVFHVSKYVVLQKKYEYFSETQNTQDDFFFTLVLAKHDFFTTCLESVMNFCWSGTAPPRARNARA